MLEIELIYFIALSVFIITVALIRSNNIVVITILNSAFSIFTVALYLILDAPDVGMTEASVSILSFVLAILAIKANYKTSYLFEDKFKPFLFVYCALLAFILIYASGDLPEFGSPKFNHYYLQNSKNDTGIISVVASILASYRGFDTMLETLVILSAGMGVLLISGEEKFIEKAQDKLTAVMIRIMLPIILLFALYIQFHGEISPGGGFQAGCIIATIFITYALGFGDNILLKTISNFNLKIITIIGISLYILVGMIGLLGGQDFLNYNVFFGQTIGVMLVELGVGITVSSTMLLIYLRVSSNASN